MNNLRLHSHPMVGFPILPVADYAQGSRDTDFQWAWRRHDISAPPDADAPVVGRRLWYTPTTADIGFTLSVTATPLDRSRPAVTAFIPTAPTVATQEAPSSAASEEASSAESEDAVSAAPAEAPSTAREDAVPAVPGRPLPETTAAAPSAPAEEALSAASEADDATAASPAAVRLSSVVAPFPAWAAPTQARLDYCAAGPPPEVALRVCTHNILLDDLFNVADTLRDKYPLTDPVRLLVCILFI